MVAQNKIEKESAVKEEGCRPAGVTNAMQQPPDSEVVTSSIRRSLIFSYERKLLETIACLNSLAINPFFDCALRDENECPISIDRNRPLQKDKRKFIIWGFIASYESFCVIKQLCFVGAAVRELLQIKNLVYPLCVMCNL